MDTDLCERERYAARTALYANFPAVRSRTVPCPNCGERAWPVDNEGTFECRECETIFIKGGDDDE